MSNLNNNVFLSIVSFLYKQPQMTNNSENIKEELPFDNDDVRLQITALRNAGFINKLGGATRNPIWQLTKEGISLAKVIEGDRDPHGD